MSVFISGSMSIKELSREAQKSLSIIIMKEIPILVGDAPGVDLLVQEYCKLKGYTKVTVYCSYSGYGYIKAPRNNVRNWPVKYIEVPVGVTGRQFYTEKDLAMAADCKYGLCIFDGRSQGTLSNIKQLIQLGKKVAVVVGEIRTDLSTDLQLQELLNN